MEGIGDAAASCAGQWCFWRLHGATIGELVSAAANLVLAVTAIATAAIALLAMHSSQRSTKAADDANIAASRTAEGSFLLQLDEMYEGPNYIESRQKFAKLGREIEAEAKKSYPERTSKEYQLEVRRLFTAELNRLYTSDIKEYMALTKIGGLFETMAIMARRNLIDKELIVDLYGNIILTVADRMEEHIRFRRSAGDDRTNRFFLEFLSLAEEVRQRRAQSAGASALTSVLSLLSRAFSA